MAHWYEIFAIEWTIKYFYSEYFHSNASIYIVYESFNIEILWNISVIIQVWLFKEKWYKLFYIERQWKVSIIIQAWPYAEK